MINEKERENLDTALAQVGLFAKVLAQGVTDLRVENGFLIRATRFAQAEAGSIGEEHCSGPSIHLFDHTGGVLGAVGFCFQ